MDKIMQNNFKVLRTFQNHHSPTIKNEVAKTLYATLAGIISSLEYDEEDSTNPDQQKLTFYSAIRQALATEKRKFVGFSDNEIETKTAPISELVKALGNNPKSNHYAILQQNSEYLAQLLSST